MESAKFSFNGIDVKKTLTHLAVYGIGFGIIAALQELTKLDFGQYSEVVGLITGFVIDSIRKYLQGK